MELQKNEKQQKKNAAKSWQVHRDYGAKLRVCTIFIGFRNIDWQVSFHILSISNEHLTSSYNSAPLIFYNSSIRGPVDNSK